MKPLLDRLSALQARRPWWVLFGVFVTALLSARLASRLELRTRFDQLLPEDAASVVELRRLEGRIDARSNVFVLLEGEDRAQLRAQGDALVPRLRAIGPPWVATATDGIAEARAFLRPRAGLFLSLAELRELQQTLDDRLESATASALGVSLDDKPPPPIDFGAFTRKFGGTATPLQQWPDGWFERKDGKALVVWVRSAITPGDLGAAREALARIETAVEASPAPGVKVGYAGDVVTGIAEYGAVQRDLVHVGALGVGLVLLVVALYFARARAIVAMGATIAVGLAWTFAATALAIGHLNALTGFLVSIVAGNGINAGIVWTSRFLEARREGWGVEASIRLTHAETFAPTLAASTTAAFAYGSLAISSFRGFRHFAGIGAFGMLACWLATFLVTPSVLALWDRHVAFGSTGRGWFARLRRSGTPVGAPFATLVQTVPRTLVIAGIALAIGALAGGAALLRKGAIETDMRKLQNDLGEAQELYRVSALAREILGAREESSMVVVADRVDQVEALAEQLRARRDSAPAGARPFEAVHTLGEFVPERQSEKLPVLLEMGKKLRRAIDKGWLSADEAALIMPYLPPADLLPFAAGDLPASIADPFTEKDGVRGRIVFIEPTAGRDDNDLRYLLLWADSFRETRLPDGAVVHGSGRAVIFADMLRSVLDDMPKAIALSLALTLLTISLAFRGVRRATPAIASLLLGVGFLALGMWLFEVRLQFLSFVALPITFGIGAEYAINVARRWEVEGDVGKTLRTTGGAVVVCSATTIVGYSALLGSVNQAVRGLGAVAVLGEIGCVLAAVLVLPAALSLLGRERIDNEPSPEPQPSLGG